jgi:hypothetical protein
MRIAFLLTRLRSATAAVIERPMPDPRCRPRSVRPAQPRHCLALPPRVTGMTVPECDALITTITTLQQEQWEAELDKRRAHCPERPAPAPGVDPVSLSPTGCWLPSCTIGSRFPMSPSPPCSVSVPKPATGGFATPDACCNRRATPSNPPTNHRPAWTTFTTSPPRQASPSHHESPQRVDDLRSAQLHGADGKLGTIFIGLRSRSRSSRRSWSSASG